MLCRVCRNPRKFLRHRCPLHRHLAWPLQPRLLHLLFRPCLPLFWPLSPPRFSKCCPPSKLQAFRLVVYLQAWPISEAFLLRLLSPANLLPKRRRLPLLALAFPLPYRPRQFLLLQVGQIVVLSLPLCRLFLVLFHRSLTRPFPVISTRLFPRPPLAPRR